MAEDDSSDQKRLKTAYELALERMENDGIERPRSTAFSSETLSAMDEARRRAEAKLAELEILRQNKLKSVLDPSERQLVGREYQADRRRIEERKERELSKLRQEAGTKLE